MRVGRLYTVVFENVTVSAAQDLFELSPADDKPIYLHGLFLANVGGVADAGDAQEEMLRLLIRRGHTVSGSGGTAPTPRATNSTNSTAAGFAAEVNNTTIANTGTTHDMHADGWNVRVPYIYLPTPEMRIQATQADATLVVRLLSTPADALSVSGTLYVEES